MEILAPIMCIVYIAALSAGTSYLLEYAFGFPMGQNPNSKAVFFSYTYFLAAKTMKKVDLLAFQIQKDDRVGVVRFARNYWKWQLMAGMCKICSNVWLSLILYIIAVIAYPTLLQKGLFMTLVNGWAVILLSHLALRKPLN